MTVTTSTNKTQPLGNGVTTSFPYAFRIFAASDLVVVSTVIATGVDTPLVLGTDYTVTGAGSYNGGNVVFGVAPATGVRITIRRVMSITQQTDLRNNGAYFAETHEDVFDKQTMVDQQLQEQFSRELLQPISDTAQIGQLPTAAARANKLFSYDANGNPTAVFPSSQSATALQADLIESADLTKGASMIGYLGGTLRTFLGSLLTAAQLAASIGASLIGYIQTGTGTVATTVQARLRRVICVDDWGAVGDGVTDDSGPINLAADYCASIANNGKWKVVLKFTPGKRYRIAAASVKLYDYVRYEMYGTELVGPITGYGRITGATAVPADTDYLGQTSGAAMADTGLTDALVDYFTQSVMVDGLAATGFRYGICVRRVFGYSRIKDPRIQNCDIAIFLYGGVQLSAIDSPIYNNCNAGTVAVATCMTVNHPWKSRDMCFHAGLAITGEKGGDTQGIVVNDNVDTWFAAAILRAGSNAYRAGINFGAFAPLHANGLLVTGWFAYFPARSNNANQGTFCENFVTTACDRGMYYSRNDIGTRVGGFSAEAYTSLNPHKGTETNSFVVFENPISVNVDRISTEPSSPGSVYDKTVKVYDTGPTNFTKLTSFFIHARNIVGRIDEREFSSVSYFDSTSDATRQHGSTSIRRLTAYPTVNWELVAGNEAINESFRLAYPLTGTAINSDAIGYRPWIRRIPRNGAANTTTDLTLDTGGIANDDMGGSALGKLTVYSVRLDTGASDFAQYIVRIPYRFGGAAALLANANINDLSFQVTSASTLYRRGDVVTLNAADNYLVESVSGNVVTTAQPLRANYLAAQTVTKVAAVVTTLTAPVAQFSLTTIGTTLRMTNLLGAAIPIKFFAVLEGFSPYTFAS